MEPSLRDCASAERTRLDAVRNRTRSPEDYIAFQMLMAGSIVSRIRRHLGAGPARLLEVGCGTGGISLRLASEGFDVVAIDRQQYDSGALSAAQGYARQRQIPVSIQQADAAHLPFRTAVFDGIVCSNVIEHLDDVAGALREMRRVLKPSGLAFVDFPLFYSIHGGHIGEVVRIPWFHLLPASVVEATLRRRGGEATIPVYRSLNRITDRAFRRHARRAGLTIVATRRSYFLTHPGRKLIVSLWDAARRRSAKAAWRCLQEARHDFTGLDLLRFPMLAAAVPLSLVPGLGELCTSGMQYVLRGNQ